MWIVCKAQAYDMAQCLCMDMVDFCKLDQMAPEYFTAHKTKFFNQWPALKI